MVKSQLPAGPSVQAKPRLTNQMPASRERHLAVCDLSNDLLQNHAGAKDLEVPKEPQEMGLYKLQHDVGPNDLSQAARGTKRGPVCVAFIRNHFTAKLQLIEKLLFLSEFQFHHL